MERRDLLRGGLAGGALLVTGGGAHAAGSPGSAAGTGGVRPFELDEVGIAQLRTKLAEGRTTAVRLVELYLGRIDEIDRSGPTLRSVIEVNPDALRIAAELDALPAEARGPLHGIPILVKDNIDTGDRMATTAGSLALEGSSAPGDAFVVARLRAAGAVVLGKTNLSEWANIRSTRSTSGWSARGGQTRNPYVLDRNPCGSSSGSGSAIAASLAAAALGSETDGSVVCPSSIAGLVGIKPTVGLLSRSGVIPISHTQDTVGVMARSVADAAALLGPLTGLDGADAASAAGKGKARADYLPFLEERGLEGLRLGVLRKSGAFNPDVARVLDASARALAGAGAVLVDPVELPHEDEYGDAELDVLLFELKAGLAAYLSSRGPDVTVRSLADVIAFNEANREREMPFFGQELFLRAQEKGPLTDPAYLAAVATCRRLSRDEGIDALLAKERLDALVAATNGPAWVIDPLNGDHFSGGFSSAAAVAGYPHVTVPAGESHGLPLGVSFFGKAWSEPLLIRIAHAFERATKARRPPRFLSTLT